MNVRSLAVTSVVALVLAPVLHAATIPYSENFNGQTLGTAAPFDNQNIAWTETNTAAWSIVTAPTGFSGNSYRVNSSVAGAQNSTFNVGTALNGVNFTMQSDFKLAAFNTGFGCCLLMARRRRNQR